MEKTEVVIIPSPGIGHIVSCIEFANRLIQLNNHLTVTILFFRVPFAPDLDSYAQSLKSTDSRLHYFNLPVVDPPSGTNIEKFISIFIESHRAHVKEAITNHVLSKNDSKLSCLVLDMFCTSMIDVACELGVPSYVFFTSSAAFLGFMKHLPALTGQDLQDKDEFDIPTYVHSVPRSVFPLFSFNEGGEYMSYHGRRFSETKGLIVNTFAELEPHAIRSLVGGDDSHFPHLYTLGPLLDFKGVQGQSSDEIIKWLDDQPQRSVVFLCFGSMGSFGASQLKEIALGLERSGHRFLWSIRKPPPKAGGVMPGNFENFEDVLPDGFLERTKEQGVICGKAPQIQVLAHEAIGAFVSHCGWNSILESLWHGVPIVTWPLYAEQHLNAFFMVKDLRLAMELTLDYRMGDTAVVRADDIERAVKCVMDGDSEVRKRVQDMRELARNAVVEGGSSFNSFQSLVHEMISGNKI